LIPGPQETLGIPAAGEAPHTGAALAVLTQGPSPTCQQFFTIALLFVIGQDTATKDTPLFYFFL